MPVLSAFIDESGQRSSTTASSDHFVMSAVVFSDADRTKAAGLLTALRLELGRRPGDVLHWQNVRTHTQRVHIAQRLGGATFLTVSSVIVCKRYFEPGTRLKDEDVSYLYTMRFLLERLSWMARDAGQTLEYTLAHVKRFKLSKLREYEERLVEQPDCKIAWKSVPRGGRIDQPSRIEELQLADMVASATAQAFEPDAFGNTEQRYFREISPRLYRRGPAPVTSYGLKMHPWNNKTKAAYPWVAAL
jgi:hypothetical protein